MVTNFQNTRHLTLKDRPSKLAAGVDNLSNRDTVSVSLSYVQRGFVPDLQLLDNVVDIEAASVVQQCLLGGPSPSVF